MQPIKNLIFGLIGSKKVQMTVAGLIVAYLAKKGFNVSDEIVVAILGAFAAYVLGQGVADNGKNAAKVNALSAMSGTSMMPSDAIEEIKKV